MDIEQLRRYALAKPGAWADDPWGEGHLVAKVSTKIFAFLANPEAIGVKCGSREQADIWLTEYPHDATPMAYLGRSGWNDLRIHGEISEQELLEALDFSYQLVVAKLPKRERPTC